MLLSICVAYPQLSQAGRHHLHHNLVVVPQQEVMEVPYTLTPCFYVEDLSGMPALHFCINITELIFISFAFMSLYTEFFLLFFLSQPLDSFCMFESLGAGALFHVNSVVTVHELQLQC